MVACHWDDDAQNNCLSNLRWDTQKRNCADMVRLGTRRYGERSAMAKLTAVQVQEIRSQIDAGESQTRIAMKFGVVQQLISQIAKRQAWKHL